MPDELIFDRIYLIRGQKVMLDNDLADLYQVETRVLKQAVRRNINRFPDDFMFELSTSEWNELSTFLFENNPLRSQSVIIEKGRGKHSKYKPFAFTEQGVAMLSGILNSERAVAVNIQIMRIFIKMRRMITDYKELLERIEKLEADQIENNEQIGNVYKILKELLEPEIRNRKLIGFKLNKKK
ncbi:MAG: ORF6N domain-containing protein [Bacteroidales bacterium]|nr:ORF6N domain-containing protein [Bacteroidales bacterium]